MAVRKYKALKARNATLPLKMTKTPIDMGYREDKYKSPKIGCVGIFAKPPSDTVKLRFTEQRVA